MSARNGHSMAYDRARERIILFGGVGDASNSALQDTWEYSRDSARQPVFQFTAAAASAGFVPSLVTGLRVRAHCGGTFAPYGAGGVGASLLGWMAGGPGLPPGSWQQLATNTAAASPSAPYLPTPPFALIDWSAATAEQAQQSLLARDRRLDFQCRPAGVSGDGDATVVLDYLEVRVRYRAPCRSGADCGSGYCNTRSLVCTSGAVGEGCSARAECASGYCRCAASSAPAAPREACASGGECASGYCSTLSHVCTGGAAGGVRLGGRLRVGCLQFLERLLGEIRGRVRLAGRMRVGLLQHCESRLYQRRHRRFLRHMGRLCVGYLRRFEHLRLSTLGQWCRAGSRLRVGLLQFLELDVYRRRRRASCAANGECASSYCSTASNTCTNGAYGDGCGSGSECSSSYCDAQLSPAGQLTEGKTAFPAWMTRTAPLATAATGATRVFPRCRAPRAATARPRLLQLVEIDLHRRRRRGQLR